MAVTVFHTNNLAPADRVMSLLSSYVGVQVLLLGSTKYNLRMCIAHSMDLDNMVFSSKKSNNWK